MVTSLIDELRSFVRDSSRARVFAGQTKGALSGPGFNLSRLSGVTQYDPQEFTITARAGTTLAELHELLGRNRQHLPFDPPLRSAGATLGGTLAAGLSGPGRYRFGGIRDFILGVRFIDGRGQILNAGGKVVKNAAGFDFPKLMTGSLGEFGILTEATFKVFPVPEATSTLAVEVHGTAEALALIQRLARSPLELTALEYHPPGRVLLRISGSAAAHRARVQRVIGFIGTAVDLLRPEEGHELWAAEREFSWVPAAHKLVKIALNPVQVSAFDSALYALAGNLVRRYGVAGNVAHLAWPAIRPADELEALLQRFQLPALPLTGEWPASRLGAQPGRYFADRIRSVLDPEGKFNRASLSEKELPA
jgi:glycolate oxidase FAD binding subunit